MLSETRKWQDMDKKLMKEFTDTSKGEMNPDFAFLKKVFLRKIKRKKKVVDGESDDEDESSSDLSDSSDSEFDETCPENCDKSMYNKILELREKRLDLEDALIIMKKKMDQLNNTNKALLNKEKNITKNVE